MNFTLLGCGRWGSFIAWYLDNKKNFNVTVWGRDGDPIYDNLKNTKKNEYVTLPDSIKLTSNLFEALDASEYIIISIASQATRELMQSVSKHPRFKDKKYILCMKGIEEVSGKRLSTVLVEYGVPEQNIAVWVGPGHIQAFTMGVPSVMLIDSYNESLSKYLVETLKTDLIRFYQGKDIVGSEIGAAAKNVMGIAAGFLDGLDYSTLKGGLMARGTREIARLIKACGGNEMSAYGLCHLGDYEATLFSKYSHNRMWGEKYAKGEKFDKLAEGVATSAALLKMAKKVKIELPITQTVYNVIYNHADIKQSITELFKRKSKPEFE